VGKAAALRTENGFDLFDLAPSLPSPPSSYGGISGGGIWRTYIDSVGDGRYLVRGRRLIDVPFFQLPAADDSLYLVCHGPKSIYELLTVAVERKWGP
jgi:hypothetical protein